MKKFLLLAFIFGLIGCGNNNKINLIESFVCTIDGVTSDLNFKMIKLTEIDPITAIDSLTKLVCDTVVSKYNKQGDFLSFTYPDKDGTQITDTITKSDIDNTIERWIKEIEECKKNLKEAKADLSNLLLPVELNSLNYSTDYINIMSDLYKTSIESNEGYIELAKSFIESYNSIKKYLQMPSDTVLLRAFDCTYSILNPLLKVKQTQTQTFYFDSELTKVICSSDYKK
jgi:hypothetical protein